MAGSTGNWQWVYKSRPGKSGMSPSLFEMQECAMPSVQDGEVLFALHLVSLDPTIRNAMAGPEAADRREGSLYYSLMDWIPGQVITWTMLAQVVETKSKDLDFHPGDLVLGKAPLRKLFSLTPAEASQLTKVPPGISPTAMMSILGATPMTGFLAAKYSGRPQPGEVAFVSGAAGATGLMACQTFKALGCRVLGSAGSDEKVALLQSLGVEAFNYKRESYLEGLRRLCPGGLNIAFDNVGGECLEAMLEMINELGRVVLCGAISQYDTRPEQKYGVRNLFQAIAKQVKLEGILVYGYTPEQMADCQETLARWARDGTVRDTSTVVEGFERFPEALMGLFAGANTGKMILRVPLQSSAL